MKDKTLEDIIKDIIERKNIKLNIKKETKEIDLRTLDFEEYALYTHYFSSKVIPEAPDGYIYKFISFKLTRLRMDLENFYSAIKEGWVPVPHSRHYYIPTDKNSGKDFIYFQGHILCEQKIEGNKNA